ncbi:MOSC domain-containing protein [Leptospira interrogans]
MNVVGRIESVWRYPVKSMRGEMLPEAYVSFSGVLGDRLYAVHNSAAPTAFPYLTARTRPDMLRYRPFFREPARSVLPSNLAEAEARGPGITPLFPGLEDLAVDVETPSGEILGVDDDRLLGALADEPSPGELTMRRSDRAITDCRPLSLLATRTIDGIGRAVGVSLDKRRFRENLYLDLNSGESFAEDAFVGRRLRIGPKLTVHILERDIRCRMINIDPDTLEENSEILQYVAKNHDNRAGVYAAVLVEGLVRPGDAIIVED